MEVWDAATTVGTVMEALGLNLDGSAASASSLYRHRAVLNNALGYAAKHKAISANPLTDYKIRKDKAKATTAVDRRSPLVNPTQAQKLLEKVRERLPATAWLCTHSSPRSTTPDCARRKQLNSRSRT